MPNVEVVQESGMNNNSHLVIQMLFLPKAPKISRLSGCRIKIPDDAYSVKLVY